MNYKIYALVDPRTNEIRYIGQTKQNLNRRLTRHIIDANRKKTHKDCWIFNLKQKNVKPIIELIDEVNENDWSFWEQHYISLYKYWGFDLTNHTIGGEGKPSYPAWNKGIKQFEDVKLKISNTLKGKHCSINTEIKKGQRISKNTEFKKGQKPWNRNKKHSFKSIEKMRKSHLGQISANRNLSFKDAENIRTLRKEGMKIKDIAKQYNISITSIKAIIYNKYYLK